MPLTMKRRREKRNSAPYSVLRGRQSLPPPRPRRCPSRQTVMNTRARQQHLQAHHVNIWPTYCFVDQAATALSRRIVQRSHSHVTCNRRTKKCHYLLPHCQLHLPYYTRHFVLIRKRPLLKALHTACIDTINSTNPAVVLLFAFGIGVHAPLARR